VLSCSGPCSPSFLDPWPCRRRNYDPSKRRELFNDKHSLISQNNQIFSDNAVRFLRLWSWKQPEGQCPHLPHVATRTLTFSPSHSQSCYFVFHWATNRQSFAVLYRPYTGLVQSSEENFDSAFSIPPCLFGSFLSHLLSRLCWHAHACACQHMLSLQPPRKCFQEFHAVCQKDISNQTWTKRSISCFITYL